MIPPWLAVSAINIICGIAFGILFMRSSVEMAKGKPPFLLFGRGSFAAVLASGLINALLGVALLMLPSAFLLRIFNLMPLSGANQTVWIFALLTGVGIGKAIRWWRWKKTHDFA